MKREFTENEKEFIGAIVGLFILLPNPELNSRKGEIMNIAYNVLNKLLDEYVPEPEEELTEEELAEIEFNDMYYQYLLEDEED